MSLVINKCVTAVKVSNFSGHYLRNRSTLDTGVLGYIGIVQHKEHSPEVLSIPPGTPCIILRFSFQISMYAKNFQIQFINTVFNILYKVLMRQKRNVNQSTPLGQDHSLMGFMFIVIYHIFMYKIL